MDLIISKEPFYALCASFDSVRFSPTAVAEAGTYILKAFLSRDNWREIDDVRAADPLTLMAHRLVCQRIEQVDEMLFIDLQNILPYTRGKDVELVPRDEKFTIRVR